MHVYVKWNSPGKGSSGVGAPPWPFPERRACDAVGGAIRPEWREESGRTRFSSTTSCVPGHATSRH